MAQAFKVKRLPDLGIELVEANSDRHFARHMHAHFGIGLMLGGAQRSASGRGQVQALPGDLISVNPGEVHDGSPLGEGARHWCMLYFDPQLIVDTLSAITAEHGKLCDEFAYPVFRHHEAGVLFRTLYLALAQYPERPDTMLLEQTLPLLLHHFLDHPVMSAPPLGAGVRRAKAMIDDNPLGAQSLTLLSQEAGLSRFQLIRAFTRYTHLTPHAYVLQKRIGQVRELIARGMSLAQAADICGFADQSHMTRHFVRSFGFTPGAYAKQCQ